jgi:type I restriction enzyme S subunit
MVVRPIDESLSFEFIKFLFIGGIDISKTITGAAQPQITRQTLSPVLIPIPPLQEQQRIVTILDEAFAAIAQAKANAEQNLQNAKELFESYLQSVFENKGEGWEEKTLGEVCELISGQHIDAKDYNFLNQGIGYLTGPSDFGPLNPVITKWTEKPKIKAQSGDILITVKGSGVGKVNILNQNEIAISRQLMAIRVTKASKAFIYAILSIKNEYFRELSTGAAIPGISRLQVLGLPIFIPSLSEQQAIVEKLDALSTETKQLEAIYQQKINDLDELKKSILQKAFAGELNTSALELEV